MIAIVNLSSKSTELSLEALAEIDSALASIGLKKQVRTSLIPGKEFATTYEGPSTVKLKIEGVVAPLAEKNGLIFNVEVEESVNFP